MIDTKYCPSCEETKSLDEFYRVKAARYAGGYRYRAYCKACTKAKNKFDIKNAPEGSKLRETVRRVKREWKHSHRPQLAAYARDYRRLKPDKIKGIRQRYVERNKAQLARYHAKWYQQRKARRKQPPTNEG